jgi:hypothetical protein
VSLETSEISERSFEEAIECARLQHGPDACDGQGAIPSPLSPGVRRCKTAAVFLNTDLGTGPGITRLATASAREYFLTRCGAGA